MYLHSRWKLVNHLINYNVFRMKPCFIKISSKNKSSLLKFSSLIFKKFNFKIGSKIILKKTINSHTKKKLFTILKSPHVNKKAQEQFEIKIFSQKLMIYTFHDTKFIYFLKNLKLRLFPDIKLKIELFVNKNNSFKTKVFNPYNFRFNLYQSFLTQTLTFKKITKKKHVQQMNYKNNLTKNLKNSCNYLTVLTVYGKLFKKNQSLDSSVGRAKD